MASFWWSVFGIFSPYADPRERRVARLLRRLDAGASRFDASGALREVMSRELLRLTVLTEWKFKGYRPLASKRYRRRLYAAADAIARRFTEWFLANRESLERDCPAPGGERALWLHGIMRWLAPGNGVFRYEEGAAFERLLRDPAAEPLVGDCNQVSTLYAWLWSLRFPVTELEAKFPPGHACLRVLGRDVECTAGRFLEYPQTPASPIEELCAVNVLDVPDAKIRAHRPTAQQLERAATFAFLFSSRREITEGNLRAAWRNLANRALADGDWDAAWDWYGKLGDAKWRADTARNAALGLASRGKFAQAEDWAGRSGDPEVRKAVLRSRAAAAYRAKDWAAARKWYDRAGEPESVRTSWMAEYAELFNQVKNCRTADDWKPRRATVRRMRECARNGGDRAAEESCDRIIEIAG